MPNYTRSEIPLKPVYSPEDIKDFNYQKKEVLKLQGYGFSGNYLVKANHRDQMNS
jgi:hypothetical protein